MAPYDRVVVAPLVNQFKKIRTVLTSDHKIVYSNVKLEAYKGNVREELIYIYCKGNFEKRRKILAYTEWSVVENETDINESWAKFDNIFNGVVELFIPVCKKTFT